MLHHLQGLGVAVLALSHRAGQNRSAAQISGQHLCRLAVRGETAEDGVLTVIGEDFRTLFSVVFLQLCQTLDNGYQRQAPGTACGEQRQDIKGRHGAQLVAEEHHTVLQLSVVFIRQEKQFPGKVLDHQTGHKIFGSILFRENQKNSTLLPHKLLCINASIKAQHLFQLRIQKSI